LKSVDVAVFKEPDIQDVLNFAKKKANRNTRMACEINTWLKICLVSGEVNDNIREMLVSLQEKLEVAGPHAL